MSIPVLCIRRPIATSLLSAALLLSGAIGYVMIPVASLPAVDYPTIQVSARLPGASPQTMASSVATPLERMLGHIAGLSEMTSSSQLGSTSIVLQFDLNRNIDAAARDVEAAINSARGNLPPLPTNPLWRKINPAEVAVMVLALTSDTATQPQMYDVADSILGQKISQIGGIGQVFVGGSARPAVRAEVNPLLLGTFQIGLEDIRRALAGANVNSPKGEFAGAGRQELLTDNDQLPKASGYSSLIVAYSNGHPVRLSDVAETVDASEDDRNAGMINGKPSVLLFLYRQPQANIISTADSVRAMLPQLQAMIPPTIRISVAQDRTVTIRASVREIEITLFISVLLVIFVVFLFLRSFHVTMIPGVAVPLSIVGTFGPLYLMGYTIDNLSLMALAISTGFVIDDAIVVIENVSRHVEAGMPVEEAAMRGSSEVAPTVFSMSASLIAVFLPLLLMSGIVGRLFREFAATLSLAVMLSMVVSLTTTPTLCAKLLKDLRSRPSGAFKRALEAAFQRLYLGYSGSLRWVLRSQRLILGVTLGMIALAIYLYVVIPKGFFPEQDTGRISANVQGVQDASFQFMRQKMNQYAAILESDPAVDIVSGYTGGNGAVNTASFNITLKPSSQRKATAFQVIDRLRPKLAAVSGAICYLQAVQDIRVGGRRSNAEYQYTLEGDNLADITRYGQLVLQQFRGLPELRDVNSDQQNHGLEAELSINHNTASRLGLTTEAIDNALYDAFGQRQVSTIYKGINQYHVVMEVAPEFQQTPAALDNIYVRSTAGRDVPLSAFAQYVPSTTPISVAHQGQFPAVTISFNIAPNVPLGNAVAAIRRTEQTMVLPSSIRASFQGTAQAYQATLSTEPYLVLASLVAIYIVLGILYENFVHPFTILSTLPSAGVGALLALLLFHVELNVIALIGIILLIGLVEKNAILMIDFALEAERNERKSPEDSIYKACLLRFRPILMTTMAAICGGIPLAIGGGTGAELRRPLGISIVGGLLFSQLLTLYTTPVVYLYMDRIRAWLTGRKALEPLPPGSEHIDLGRVTPPLPEAAHFRSH